MLDFYELILNIGKFDKEKAARLIEKTITMEIDLVKAYVNEMDGLCKLLSNNIKIKLTDLNFKVKLVNTNELSKDLTEYEFLIVNFKDMDNKINYVLIDTTYSQFFPKENTVLAPNFNHWPANILKQNNSELLDNLLLSGYSFINDNDLKDYLSSFSNKEINYSLEDIIIEKYKGWENETNIKWNKK